MMRVTIFSPILPINEIRRLEFAKTAHERSDVKKIATKMAGISSKFFALEPSEATVDIAPGPARTAHYP